MYIKTITVDGGRMFKRIRTAPQGRANRIRKRSNHITIILGDRNANMDIDINDNNIIEETENIK